MTDYVDIESEIDPSSIPEDELAEMDCITYHNHITHLVEYPDDRVDKLLEHGLMSEDIPESRRKAP